jgi:hypothetical protein
MCYIKLSEPYCKHSTYLSSRSVHLTLYNSKIKDFSFFFVKNGPEESRTPDLFIANEAFRPAELQAHKLNSGGRTKNRTWDLSLIRTVL